jgi:hypothetical protein
MAIETITPNALKTVMNEKFIHVAYEQQTGILYVKWMGFLRLDEVKKGGNFLIEFITKNRVAKNFNNQTALKVLSPDVQEYVSTQLFPQIEKAGMRKVGVLLAEDVFAQATVNNVNAKVTLGQLSIQTFGSERLCKEWLLS